MGSDKRYKYTGIELGHLKTKSLHQYEYSTVLMQCTVAGDLVFSN